VNTPRKDGLALRVTDLVAGYGTVPVLHEVSLEVRAGEVVALLGPNGAGKTTTLRAICGQIPTRSGTTEIAGVLTNAPLYRRCTDLIAYVTEERCIFPSLTTAQNLRLGSGGVAAAVGLFPELRPLLKRKAGLLSGGEQQMLALARAVVRRPPLLIADELSLGLAPLIIERLMAAVRDAASAGAGVLMVEQYVGRALEVADRAYVLRQGRVVMSGTAAEMQSRRRELEGVYLSGA
jgi:branched-chain amino acid transport system ATP-binding protein